MDPRDRALCTSLVYGVLRHRQRLDTHIDRHAHRPAGIKGELREVLRVAAYEMRALDRPAAIATTEALNAVASFDRVGKLRGVVQAIASGIDRTGAELDDQLAHGPPLDVLDRRWSIPRWLGGRWLKQLGIPRALRRAECLAEAPPIDLRLDVRRASADQIVARLELEHPGIAIERIPGAPSLRVRSGGDLFYGALHDEGLISIQGLAAQQPARLLEPSPGDRVLDACCGMGVKTLQLAELMDRQGEIVAVDADARQLAALAEAHRRGGLEAATLRMEIVEGDARTDQPILDERPFDRILLDVPCTGLGNLARHPEIRWHRQFQDIAAHVPLQRALLDRNLQRLRTGGTLVYAVCSAEPEETVEITASFREHRQFSLRAEHTWSPEEDGCEGFYAAVWTRLE